MTMQSPGSKSVNELQELLSINIDSQKGFQEAADITNENTLKSLFTEFSQERAHNAAELHSILTSAGQKPTSSGSVSGAMHRWWLDAKHALTGKDPQAILSEAERGEDTIRDAYESALHSLSEPTIRSLVERQYRNVQKDHERVKSLRDSYRRNPPA